MTRHAMQRTGDHLEQSGICILSLDGGGVRGLFTLLILKALMSSINTERLKDGKLEAKPCDIFDLIGGTSTGGIIAIMLGRLEMSVDECITTYTRMFEKVFGKRGLPVNIFGKVKGRFDSIVLEECIADILKERKLPEDEPLINDKGCKVAVCAVAAENSATVVLRSYTSTEALNNLPATICQAVRATSAATSFFEPVTIGPYKRNFVDGALSANNPVDEIWNEAQNVWCTGDTELNDMLKCVISIGTGDPGTQPIAEGIVKLFSRTLVQMATETQNTEHSETIYRKASSTIRKQTLLPL
ncbi:hypothetical protein BP6252_01158 [Coleophoma cylindrospora]|uniref:PNPLA domain-containing protein n=1 Tax=Coleophoma cylindrospora TaxID=1849047 RepID=A0A3D8SS37_9HELO|nr:hypothetical protein BP6252_01158 [Coleophoma cylindrospora]